MAPFIMAETPPLPTTALEVVSVALKLYVVATSDS